MSNRASNRAAREAAAAQDARDYRFSCTALKITGGVGAVATLVSLWLTIRVWTEGQMATLTRFVPVMVVIASVYIVGLCVRRYRALTASGHVRGWREDMPDGPRTILGYSFMLLGVIANMASRFYPAWQDALYWGGFGLIVLAGVALFTERGWRNRS